MPIYQYRGATIETRRKGGKFAALVTLPGNAGNERPVPTRASEEAALIAGRAIVDRLLGPDTSS